MYVCLSVRMLVFMDVYLFDMYVCKYVCVCVCVCVCVPVCLSTLEDGQNDSDGQIA